MITSSTTTVTFPEDDPGIWIPKEGEFYRTLSQNSSDNSSSIDKKRAYLYQLKSDNAESILQQMHQEISNWPSVAKKFGITNSEIEQTKRAFRLVEKRS